MPCQSSARFRATTGPEEAFGTTPQEVLAALMQHLSTDAFPPIVIWPYNLGGAYFSDAQQARLRELRGRQETLTADEHTELEGLVAAAFDATIARTRGLWAMPARQDEQMRNNG